MNCIVTAGPTYEPLDDVRRLTNFSTGRLGTELANHLAACGHKVTLLIGESATYAGERMAQSVRVYSTAEDLRAKLKSFSGKKVDAIFHAAAVSDFGFGKVFAPNAAGEFVALKASKKNLHPRGRTACGTGAHAKDHRGTARLVSENQNRRLEVRGRWRACRCVTGGPETNRRLPDGFLRGERAGLWDGVQPGFKRRAEAFWRRGKVVCRTGNHFQIRKTGTLESISCLPAFFIVSASRLEILQLPQAEFQRHPADEK